MQECDKFYMGDNHPLVCFFPQFDNNQLFRENMSINLTWGSTEKGEESPTSPAVNEPAGVWILNPSFLNMKASPLSDMI